MAESRDQLSNSCSFQMKLYELIKLHDPQSFPSQKEMS